MATQVNNDRKETTPIPSSSSNKAKNAKSETAAGKTHTYDPVGMAGQKAGIVEEMEQKLRQDGGEKGKDSSIK